MTADELLAIPTATITAAGLRTNIDVGIQYMAAWLSGNGCVPIYNLRGIEVGSVVGHESMD